MHEEEMNGFHVLRAGRGPGKFKTVTFVLGCLWHLWRLRDSYEIIHAHLLFGPAFSAALAGRILGKRVIAKLGASGMYGEIHIAQRSSRGRLTLALVRRWLNALVVLDDDMKQEAMSAGFSADRVIQMDNGIDAMSFNSTRSREDEKTALGMTDKTVVLFVGRLVQQKSLPTLLQAIKLAVQFSPKLHLMLVGSGAERESLEALTRSLGIQEFVTFAGNQADVRPFLRAADIFVLPSEKEGMSNALLEGMASGLACLATPVGASPKLLDHGASGLLLPVGDISAWSNALVGLGNSPNRRAELGQAARQQVMKVYDFSVVGARYQMLYESLTRHTVSRTETA